mmetsp:Transcript_9085/g.11098  ORF Transcript_9085/g.11098 Transcript_9085/m.11098 type:complete len:119 (-) Transcript_9085:7256-7612(-)
MTSVPDPANACEAGYYCNAKNNDKFALPCPAGHKCTPSVGAQGKSQCVAGTYQPNTIQTNCLPCPAGYYCPNLATELPTICPEGHYCPANSITYQKCPVGKFSDLKGLSAASDCQLGA